MRIVYLKKEKVALFAEACLSLSPRVFVYQDSELYIDITTTLKWFGGEEKWLTAFEKVRHSFSEKTPYVLTDRIEWAKALYEKDEVCILKDSLVIPPNQSQQWLWQSPIERLMTVGDPMLLAAERKDRQYLVSFMRRVGLNWVSDFAALETTVISRRFGKMGVVLQEWLMGEKIIPLPTFVPKEPIKDFIDAAEVGSLEGLLFKLEEVFERLSIRLTARAEAASQIKMIFHLDGLPLKQEWLKFHEPLRETARLLKPLREYLSQPRWEVPLRFVEIEVVESSPFTGGQLSLFDTTENRMSDLSYYVQNLRGRLGENAVGFADLQESYLPERSWKKVWPPKPATTSTRPFLGVRPPILFTPARPYTPSRHFKLLPGEHLASEWWEEHGAYRRYFIAHTTNHEKLWVYWDCQKKEWFLQGTFD